MDRSRILKLISQEYKQDEIGQQVPEETGRIVYCSVSSVSGSEWHNGGRNGIRPEMKITMFRPDYHGELIAELDGERYAVYRTFMAGHELIELYLERKAGV